MKYSSLIPILAAVLLLAGGPAAAGPEARVQAFRKALSEKAAAAEAMTVIGKDGWLFPANELRHISVGPFWGESAQKVSRASRADRKDPLAAIVAYHQACKAAGIELILLPVPAKSVVYPDMITDLPAPAPAGQGKRMDTAHQQFYKILGEKGVRVLDITDDLIAARAAGEKVYCKTDAHFSPVACRIAAKKLAEHMGKPDWLKDAKALAIETARKEFKITGDLIATLPPGKKMAQEQLAARFVHQAGTDQPVDDDESSPVLILADSHGLVYHIGDDMHVKGAGLVDQLVAELGIGVDLIAARGSAATPVRITLYRKGARDANYLAAKKVIVWCFTVREFTETSGWAKIPLKR
ncbi:MAG: alginate O-acetyltransferase AlgX-related protein [Planctomycetota bacterium]